MANFSGSCKIKRVGQKDVVLFDLKPVSGTAFDWTWFLAKKEYAREMLAVGLAAVASNKTVFVEMSATAPYTEITTICVEA